MAYIYLKFIDLLVLLMLVAVLCMICELLTTVIALNGNMLKSRFNSWQEEVNDHGLPGGK